MIIGNNGEGKTNILEGISYLCLSKSFFNASDSMVIKTDEQSFRATGSMVSDGGVEYEVNVFFEKEKNEKKINVNKNKIEKASMLIGLFPVVVLSPEQNSITIGSPADRRRFVDFVISQSSKAYLDNLIDYRRLLKQRNKVLSQNKARNNQSLDEIETWNEGLIKTGTFVIKKRIEFIKEFQDIVGCSYTKISGTKERPEIFYKPSFKIDNDNANDIENAFRNEIMRQQHIELRIGYSLIGPHRDDFVLKINEFDVQGYASQGQHKTLLVALKLAEFYYLKERRKETPILLLDDVLSELDVERSQRLLEVTSDFGQIFITSTDERTLNWLPVASALPRKFYIERGNIKHVEDAVWSN